MRVYKDPETGEFVEPPPGTVPPAGEEGELTTQPDSAAPEPVILPDGGVMIELRDEHRVHLEATPETETKKKAEDEK
ncbi:MAG: hypothetical protein JSW10_08815 [Pseudomonadota bacterium]|nr:MAG: hypothetical protein JSW10_08815 [Pseudomonadota bacterium]